MIPSELLKMQTLGTNDERIRTYSFGSLGSCPKSHGSSVDPTEQHDQICAHPTQRRPASTSPEIAADDMARKVSSRSLLIEEGANFYGREEENKKQDLTLTPKRLRCAVSFRADDTDKWGAQQLDAHEDYSLCLRDQSVKIDLLERLNTFRRNRELCDVVLFVREREIYAHKVVLAAVSPALFDMFIREDEERARTQNTGSPPSTASGDRLVAMPSAGPQAIAYFEFAQTDYDCFKALVDFAYTAYLEISSKKVAELYKTAYALQMNPIAKACANYLAENLSVHNCIGIRRQANFNKDAYLVDRVDKYVTENFSTVAEESVEFTQLPVIKSRIIIPLEEVRNSKLGMSLAERALHYFERYKCDRTEHSLEQVASKTHLLYLEENHLTDCAEMDDRSSVGSCEIIQDYKKNGKKNIEKAAAVEMRGAPQFSHRVTGATAVRMDASRVPNDKYGSTESLESAGTDTSETENTINTQLLAVHQTSAEYWVALVVLFHRLVVLSLQLTDDEELTQKNKNGNGVLDAQKQNLLNRLVSAAGMQRTPLPSMSAARCSTGAVFLNGKIFVCGGYDRGECLKTVEEYDLQKGNWTSLPNMLNERGRFDTAVLNGKIYAIAGSNGNNDLKTVEVFDPKTGKWSASPSVNKARSHNGCAVLDGMIYIVGGSNDQVVMKDCERFDPKTGQWSPIAPLINARYQSGVIGWRGMVVAVGGCDRWSCVDTVEAYDPKTNTWKELCKLRTPRRGCAVAVVRDSLYVIGGHDGTQSLNTVEILDHPSGSWKPGPPLTTPRANTRAVVTAGSVIYAIGGFNGNQFLDTIELLESETVGWCNWQQKPVEFSLLEEDEEDEHDGEDQQNSPLDPHHTNETPHHPAEATHSAADAPQVVSQKAVEAQ